jgi:hypothetical protein
MLLFLDERKANEDFDFKRKMLKNATAGSGRGSKS